MIFWNSRKSYNKVIGIFTVSSGGIAGTVADPKLIFGCALKAVASGIILAHNHPSGALQFFHLFLMTLSGINCQRLELLNAKLNE